MGFCIFSLDFYIRLWTDLGNPEKCQSVWGRTDCKCLFFVTSEPLNAIVRNGHMTVINRATWALGKDGQKIVVTYTFLLLHWVMQHEIFCKVTATHYWYKAMMSFLDWNLFQVDWLTVNSALKWDKSTFWLFGVFSWYFLVLGVFCATNKNHQQELISKRHKSQHISLYGVQQCSQVHWL